MLIIFARLFLRLLILVVGVFSIFFFYVFGYTYNEKRGFIKAPGVYAIKYFSNNNFEKDITINSKKYNIVDNRLTLYGVEKGKCGNIKIGDYQKYDCYDGIKYVKIIYIPNSSIRIYPITKSMFFSQLDLENSNDYAINYNFNWHGIKFSYYKDGTIVYKDDISSKKLINIKGANFVGYNNEGLFFFKGNKIYFMKILESL